MTNFNAYSSVGKLNFTNGGTGEIEEGNDDSNLNNPLVYISWTVFSFLLVVGVIVMYTNCKPVQRGLGEQALNQQAEKEDDVMDRSERQKWYEESLMENTGVVTSLHDQEVMTVQSDDDASNVDSDYVSAFAGTGDLEAGFEGSKRECFEIVPACGKPRTIRGCCAICLSHKKPREVVVVSSSSDCPHVFHQRCLVDTFSHTRGTETNPCPICRREFVHPASSPSHCDDDSSSEEGNHAPSPVTDPNI
jgi:hypothetical protein